MLSDSEHQRTEKIHVNKNVAIRQHVLMSNFLYARNLRAIRSILMAYIIIPIAVVKQEG